VVNKLDLLPHLDFDLDRFLYNLDAVNPGVRRMLVSAKTGEGVEEFREWLRELPARAGAANDVLPASVSEARGTSNVEVGARA
jgi:hydrogenase nickel incorporation protein HypB